jgi:uncharacterized protein (TIGR02246 family)
MKKRLAVSLVALVLCAAAAVAGGIAAASGPAQRQAALEAGPRAATAAWDKAFSAGDLAKVMSLYAANAVSMPFDAPEQDGRAAIAAATRAFFKDFSARHKTTIVGLLVSGDWAIEHGHYVLTLARKSGGKPIIERGKHIWVRHRTPAGWKIVWEIWNRDAPAK